MRGDRIRKGSSIAPGVGRDRIERPGPDHGESSISSLYGILRSVGRHTTRPSQQQHRSFSIHINPTFLILRIVLDISIIIRAKRNRKLQGFLRGRTGSFGTKSEDRTSPHLAPLDSIATRSYSQSPSAPCRAFSASSLFSPRLLITSPSFQNSFPSLLSNRAIKPQPSPFRVTRHIRTLPFLILS